MSNRRLRLALLSDLHAYHPVPGKSNSSFLPANPRISDPNPFGDLEKLADEEKISVDFVVCPGDICDKADIRGFDFAWKSLHSLKNKFSATDLIATCGNHDLNSRHIDAKEDPDPKGALQTISPQFPFTSDSLTNHFWSRNYAIVEPSDGIRIVVLNTSAYHGGQESEIEFGRISQRTIASIEQELKKRGDAEANILLCHHHLRPLKGLWGNAPDEEFVKKGGDLINCLARATASPWLILHGHRHAPNLEHNTDPACVIVGASSFSGSGSGRANQFHIIDVEFDNSLDQSIRGTIESWSWTLPGGWQRKQASGDDDGFPPECGFGSKFQHQCFHSPSWGRSA